MGDLFRVYPDADVSLSYDFSHWHMVHADTVRLGRVFANILGNAVQAMRGRGQLWLKTRERGGFVEFTLGNGGSLIPPENLPMLFDAFFTSGKKGGTGLGLAIAKKIVEAHGGAIRCVSEKNEKHPIGMVEFVFTLPASGAVCAPRSDALPRSSREIQAAIAAVRIAAHRQGSAGPDPLEAEIETGIAAHLEAVGVAETDLMTVLVVDDEAVYQNGLLSLVTRSEVLSPWIRMVFARNDSEALAAVKEHNPALLIEDVDLGPNSKDGLEIVRTLRERNFSGHICVHSNRFLATDTKAANAAGADTVLPKPMSRMHFLKLLMASLPAKPVTKTVHVPEATPVPASEHVYEAPAKLVVAMLDDSVSMRIAWKMKIADETCFRAFASTAAFFDACHKDASYLSILNVVVTEYNFAPGDPHDGGTFARDLRERGYQGLILRASGETDLGAEIESLFDGDVGKSALKWPDFNKAVAEAQARQKKRTGGREG